MRFKSNFAETEIQMRKVMVLLMTVVALLSCRKGIEEKELVKINGYWEIAKTEMPDGSEKEFPVSTTIDFFQINGKSGSRTKVMPQLDGSYLTNDVSEKITVTSKDDTVYLNYSTPFAKWKEKVLSVSDDELVIINEQDITYHYRKPKPFSVK